MAQISFTANRIRIHPGLAGCSGNDSIKVLLLLRLVVVNEHVKTFTRTHIRLRTLAPTSVRVCVSVQV